MGGFSYCKHVKIRATKDELSAIGILGEDLEELLKPRAFAVSSHQEGMLVLSHPKTGDSWVAVPPHLTEIVGAHNEKPADARI